MENKGLCITCAHDKNCIFQRRFPVLECEEFFIGNSVPTRFRQARVKKVVRQEVTESE